MRYVSAYLLSVLGGNENPKMDDLKKILGSVGIDCEEDKAKLVIDNLSGKNVEELLEAGKEKLASVPSGGGAVAVAAGGAPAAGAAPAEEKKEDKKAESESEDEDMGFGLFD